MPQMSQILRVRAIDMVTAGMSTRAVAREVNVNFSTIRSHNRRPRVWRLVAEWFTDVNFEQSAPWWRWGYGIGRHKLRTTNTIAFY